jgi:hypothetical protein
LKSDRISDAIALYRILGTLGYGVRIIDADTQLKQLDIDVFASPDTPETRFLWDEGLAACSSDLGLLELAIKIRCSPGGGSRKWIDELIAQGLQAESAYDQARAVSLRGFLDAEADAEWLTEPTTDDDSWYRSVLRIAQRRAKSERDARHWFKKFCEGTDLDEAWAAFRLFLSIADRRCWLWCHEELAVLVRQAGGSAPKVHSARTFCSNWSMGPPSLARKASVLKVSSLSLPIPQTIPGDHSNGFSWLPHIL